MKAKSVKEPKTLTAAQIRVLNDTPASYQRVMTRAFTLPSKAAAVKAFCAHCVGYVRADVANCTSFGCPLWPHRPYQAKN